MKPCPFCKDNSPAVEGDPQTGHYWVRCYTCHAKGPHATTKECAVKWWDDRQGERGPDQ